MKQQVLLPAVALNREDVVASWEVQEPLVRDGNFQRGLMLVMRGGIEAVTTNAVRQKESLRFLMKDYGDTPIVVMLSNMPIEQMDWLNYTTRAKEHVIAGIRFASSLPIGGRKIVTFHLNSLVADREFLSKSAKEWRSLFKESMAPALEVVAHYASSCGVELKVETVPVPEFGDWPVGTGNFYAGQRLRNLRNPFYLTRHWGFPELRALGLGICLDVCHSRTIYKMANSNTGGVLYQEDREIFSSTGLMGDVLDLTPYDLMHLNDGRGCFTNAGGIFEEGIALGEGEIGELRAIIARARNAKVPFVLEVNETDYEHRPNTKKSIGYLLKNS